MQRLIALLIIWEFISIIITKCQIERLEEKKTVVLPLTTNENLDSYTAYLYLSPYKKLFKGFNMERVADKKWKVHFRDVEIDVKKLKGPKVIYFVDVNKERQRYFAYDVNT